MNSTNGTFRKLIWTSKKKLFLKKVDHLNSILKRNGKQPITVSFENVHVKPYEFTTHIKGYSSLEDTKETKLVEVCYAVCSGITTIKKDDKEYVYIGSVSFDEGVKQVFVKDETFIDYFNDKFRKDECDHCHTKRPNRKSYHLFSCENGEKVIQIGSTCAKEYFGINSDAFLNVQMDTFNLAFEDFGEEDFEFSKGSTIIEFETVYHLLDFCTKGFTRWVKADGGFNASDMPYDNPTSEQVAILANRRDMVDFFGKNPIELTLEECLSYWEKKELSSFTINCTEALRRGYATSRTIGSFCFAIYGAVNAKIKAKNSGIDLGIVEDCKYNEGSRISISGNVFTSKKIEVENEYSWRGGFITKYIINFKGSDNALYHISTSSLTFKDINEGDEIEIKGTVSSTKEFNGRNYTTLLRPKCIRIAGREIAA